MTSWSGTIVRNRLGVAEPCRLDILSGYALVHEIFGNGLGALFRQRLVDLHATCVVRVSFYLELQTRMCCQDA